MGTIYMLTGFVFLLYGLALSRKLLKLKMKYGGKESDEDALTENNSHLFGRAQSQTESSESELKECCESWDCSLPNRIQTSGIFIFIFAISQGFALFGGVRLNYNVTLLDFAFGMVDFCLFMTFLGMFSQGVQQIQTPNYHNITMSSQPSEETWDGKSDQSDQRDRIDSNSLLGGPLLRRDSSLSSEASEFAYSPNDNGKLFSPKTLSFYGSPQDLPRSASELGVFHSKSMNATN